MADKAAERTPKKRFPCNHCNSGYQHKSSLIKHLNVKHGMDSNGQSLSPEQHAAGSKSYKKQSPTTIKKTAKSVAHFSVEPSSDSEESGSEAGTVLEKTSCGSAVSTAVSPTDGKAKAQVVPRGTGKVRRGPRESAVRKTSPIVTSSVSMQNPGTLQNAKNKGITVETDCCL